MSYWSYWEKMRNREYLVKKARLLTAFRHVPLWENLYVWRTERHARRFKSVVGDTVALLYSLGNPLMLVEVETISGCNNDCPCCPVSTLYDRREPVCMSDELFLKIMIDLSAMDYRQVLCLSAANNEPLLDPQVVERLEMARNVCSDAFLEMNTNGILLTVDLYHELMKYLDKLSVFNFDDGLKLIEPVRNALLGATPDETSRTTIYMRHKDDNIESHGGASPTRKIYKTLDCSCLAPFSAMAVSADGRVRFCSQDTYTKYPMGDLNKQKLTDIWHGREFDQVRKEILFNRRLRGKPCLLCDYIREVPSCRMNPMQGMERVETIKEMEGFSD
jgi:radical SAM protein with 4Fe4S-binding SPASM domain